MSGSCLLYRGFPGPSDPKIRHWMRALYCGVLLLMISTEIIVYQLRKAAREIICHLQFKFLAVFTKAASHKMHYINIKCPNFQCLMQGQLIVMLINNSCVSKIHGQYLAVLLSINFKVRVSYTMCFKDKSSDRRST
jgi:hypothetical protein